MSPRCVSDIPPKPDTSRNEVYFTNQWDDSKEKHDTSLNYSGSLQFVGLMKTTQTEIN